MSVLETQSPESEDQLFRQSEHLLSQRSDWGPCEVINGAGCIVGGGGDSICPAFLVNSQHQMALLDSSLAHLYRTIMIKM